MSEYALAKTQQEFLQTLVESKKLPSHVKSVEEAFTIAQMGKELGFPIMQSFHYILPIQGRLSLSAKAIGAILRRGGVSFKTIEDGVYVYPNGEVTPYGKEGAIDRRTTILFKRNGEEEEVSFCWTDATSMGLTSKDNWKKMPKEMLWARCLSKGANRVAADLLLGLYSSDELFDSFDVSEKHVKRDEDGTIISIDPE